MPAAMSRCSSRATVRPRVAASSAVPSPSPLRRPRRHQRSVAPIGPGLPGVAQGRAWWVPSVLLVGYIDVCSGLRRPPGKSDSAGKTVRRCGSEGRLVGEQPLGRSQDCAHRTGTDGPSDADLLRDAKGDTDDLALDIDQGPPESPRPRSEATPTIGRAGRRLIFAVDVRRRALADEPYPERVLGTTSLTRNPNATRHRSAWLRASPAGRRLPVHSDHREVAPGIEHDDASHVDLTLGIGDESGWVRPATTWALVTTSGVATRKPAPERSYCSCRP